MMIEKKSKHNGVKEEKTNMNKEGEVKKEEEEEEKGESII